LFTENTATNQESNIYTIIPRPSKWTNMKIYVSNTRKVRRNWSDIFVPIVQWCWNLDASGNGPETPKKFWNVVLEEDGKDQLDWSS